MRVVLQRVKHGSVTVEAEIVGEIESGFVALVGISHTDTQNEVQLLAKKIANLRVFEDEDGKMNISSIDIGADILVISQFTLYADTRKGRRPSFIHAAKPDIAEPLLEYFVECLQKEGFQRIEKGVFGATMLVEIHNDGPITIILDTDDFK
jgi:D-aminoacyl-tRNA deacylase